MGQKISSIPISATALTGTELFEVVQGGVTKKVTATQIATFAGGAAYLVYRALISEISNEPTAIVLENTLGEIPTFGYIAPGEYTLNTSTAIFTQDKTFVMPNSFPTFLVSFFAARWASTTQILLFSTRLSDMGGRDNELINAELQILVYP